MQGKYQTRPDRPFVPGRDASGVAVAVGRNVSRVKAGDRVIAQVTTGAFAEKLAAPQARCFRIPDSLDFVSAAGMVTIYNTAYVAVVIRGRVKRGETVLVTGASGGVGLATVQVAKAKGARVLAGVTSKEKGQVALASGADALIDLSAADLRESLRQQVFALTDNRGVDAVFDPVGGDVFDAALRAVAYAGRMVIIGFASGRIPEVKGHYVLLKNIAVVGAPLDIHFKMEPQVMDAAVADIFRMYENGRDQARDHGESIRSVRFTRPWTSLSHARSKARSFSPQMRHKAGVPQLYIRSISRGLLRLPRLNSPRRSAAYG